MKKLSLLITLVILGAQALVAQEGGVDTSTFDRSIRPQDDLFLYVNGTWLKNTEIPDDKSNYGSFIALADLSQERIKALIEEIQTREFPAGSDGQKIKDLYASFMDTQTLEAKGAEPVLPMLKQIDEIDSKATLFKKFGEFQRKGLGTPIGFFVRQDDKDSTRYVVNMIQSGTSLPDRDYYLKDGEKKYMEAREALKAYVSKLYELAGLPNGDAAAEAVLKLETKLANAQWPRVELRNPTKRYNLYKIDSWNEYAPGLDWSSFFAAAGVSEPGEFVVMTPSFFKELAGIMEGTSLEDWKHCLRFNTLDGASPYLSKDFFDANFELYQKQLAGIKQPKPRWKRAIDMTSGMMGEALGKLYVEKHFKPEAKAAMKKLVDNLLTAFGNGIDDLTWMTDETKKRAKEKLSKINTKIGYPDKWRDYSKLKVSSDSLIDNVLASTEFEYARNIGRLGKPVDRDEWGMTPQTVNAYYNPSLNEIVFPAAILQPPFFSLEAPDALNYGGIGAVIGHEISHAFDDQGSKYDGDGNLKNWWTEKDAAAFKGLTEQLIAQYSEYEPLPSKKVNGKFTLGENIADLSGLAVSYRAFKISLGDSDPGKVAGWTADQLFFVGWSRVWQRKYRDAEMVRRLLIDPHSPSQYRANGPVTNIDAFYKAFDLKEGDRLFKPKEERIKIW